ncbi:glycosyltransferase family 9 protein [Massilia sp. Dwa41.01b]|uniref:glycosyltransferase family 9 protein n=1 Tax=Massilia sp. Dwa41.01b TaxID=2709302 RepID=UPI001603E531|nr:glycosyltransferase family 9 protein [Massilia sp. Dwa41.01b]QNA87447.1 glycosyltransferase family 9 protein [Massilia sp. Dwa41.01b]
MYRRPLFHRLDIESVVVFRALHLGDMLCAVPALRALRASLPKARVTLVGLPWARQFAQRFRSYIDDFVPFPGHPKLPEQEVRHEALTPFYADMCSRRFSLALQLHGNGLVSNEIVAGFGAGTMAGYCRDEPVATEHTVLFPYPELGAESERLLSLVERLGAQAVGDYLEFPLAQADRQELEASGVAPDLAPGSYICVHPGARKRDKCWPPQRFAEVADRLAAEFGVRVVLTGSADEAGLASEVASNMQAKAINAAAPISIGAMAALMKNARLLVCNDTGVSHIAAGLRLKSVVIFSKADIARWAPLDRDQHRCIWDPDAQRSAAVLQHARALLAGTDPGRQRTAGMWPYW